MEKNSLIKSNPLIIERIVNLGGIDRKVYVQFFDYPYPHAIIDDFFDKKSFKNISLSLAGKDNEPTYKNDFLKGFNTNLEAGKKVFGV